MLVDRSLPELVLDTLERHGLAATTALKAELNALLSPTRTAHPPADLQTWADEPRSEPDGSRVLPERYREVRLLGVGGMGSVCEVADRVLGRVVAMKIAHQAGSSASRSRFLAEAQVLAQLQHPNIVPIYDLGTLPSGQPYFTMPIVRGETLTDLIREVHAAVGTDGWQPGARGTTFHRLITTFHAMADAIAYAHARGVIHRDLKPDNVMVGPHGATVVVDWGLAKVLGAPDDLPPVSTYRTGEAALTTMVGAVIGTLGYMPPEQARGEWQRLDARADVHALGATLYEILCGAPPFSSGDRFDALTQVIHSAPPPILAPGPVPAELSALVARCVAKDPEDRPVDAGEVARTVNAWLEGASRRARALAEVERSDELLGEIERLRRTAEHLREEAAQRLAEVAPYEPEARKRDAWRMQDQATGAEVEADLLEVKRVEQLRAALRIDPELPEGHARLADHFRAQHQVAEARSEHGRANELLHLLRSHDLSGSHASYLDGAGTVTVVTDPPGAEVEVWRFEERDRRRVAVPFGRLGTTPVIQARLPMGSYRLELRHPQRATVWYPVHLDRCTDWQGVAPGEGEPRPIRLPLPGDLGPLDRYVPAGYARLGGDPEAEWPRPAEVRWIEGFVMRKHPVSNQEYLGFLDALVASGREEEAARYEPRYNGEPVYGRDREGRYLLQPDRDGDEWLPTHPVLLIDWHSAAAFAAWEAERTGQPWRLAWELEREKAARGVDGRLFPWGNAFDPSWTWMRSSQPSPGPRPVDERTRDVSPYGVHGLAGNAHDWCLDLFRSAGPSIGDPSVWAEGLSDRAIRGGTWSSGARWCRAASRGVASSDQRETILSFRLARSLG